MQSAPFVPSVQTLWALLRTTVMRHPTALLLAGCAAGLSCSLLAAPIAFGPAQAGTLIAQTATEKASPFAGAKDETSSDHGAEPAAPTAGSEQASSQATGEVDGTPKELAGTKAAGTKKNSPFAGAKESDEAAHADLRADRTRLWWLLLPVGLAAIGYGALRSNEGEGRC